MHCAHSCSSIRPDLDSRLRYKQSTFCMCELFFDKPCQSTHLHPCVFGHVPVSSWPTCVRSRTRLIYTHVCLVTYPTHLHPCVFGHVPDSSTPICVRSRTWFIYNDVCSVMYLTHLDHCVFSQLPNSAWPICIRSATWLSLTDLYSDRYSRIQGYLFSGICLGNDPFMQCISK